MNPVDRSVLLNEYDKNIEWYLEDNKKYNQRNGSVTFSPDLRDSMIKVAQILTNTKEMMKALKTLNEAMLAKYEKEVGGTVDPKATQKTRMNQLKTEMAKANRAEDNKSRHLLSSVLTKFEEDNGFKTFQAHNGHPRIIQMTGLLTGKDFLGTLGAGHMAKDYVTVEHGVYSHRIQWYCLGQVGTLKDLANLFIKFQEGIAWLLTFDRRDEHPRRATSNGTISYDDFRTPEKLHAFFQMTDADAWCPLVAQYIKGKDDAIKNHDWNSIRMAVAARKLYPDDKAKLDGWKSLAKGDLLPKIKAALGPEKFKFLEEFMKKDVDGHNVLYPQSDGKYATTKQA